MIREDELNDIFRYIGSKNFEGEYFIMNREMISSIRELLEEYNDHLLKNGLSGYEPIQTVLEDLRRLK